jgi:hypothetical protein
VNDSAVFTKRLNVAFSRIGALEARAANAIEACDVALARVIDLEAQLAAAREALQATRDDLVTYGLDDFDGTTKEAIDRIDAALATAPHTTDGEKK